jgi:hypothetical protein
MALPALLRLAKKPQPDRERVRTVGEQIEARVRAAEQGGYRVEALFDTR